MSKSKIRVGFLTALNPKDKRSWSGTTYRMCSALEEEFETVVCYGPLTLNPLQEGLLKLSFFLQKSLHRLVYGKKFNVAHNHTISKIYGRLFTKKVAKSPVDVIFAPSASVEIAYLQTDIPIYYLSDATFDLICNYYDAFKELSSKSIEESNEIEQLAIQRSKAQIFSSQWAINSAISRYNASKTFLVKLGANLDKTPDLTKKVTSDKTSFTLLFIGVDWLRKGGPLVLETLDILVNQGHEIKLIVCGCEPNESRNYMQVIPFLDKNKPSDLEKIEKLYFTSDILFMPTKADCTPIAFCEANAFGLPVISSQTGGVDAVIENDVNGLLLPPSAKASEYAALIESLIHHPIYLKELSISSRKKFEDELNWKVWGKKMKDIITSTHTG